MNYALNCFIHPRFHFLILMPPAFIIAYQAYFSQYYATIYILLIHLYVLSIKYDASGQFLHFNFLMIVVFHRDLIFLAIAILSSFHVQFILHDLKLIYSLIFEFSRILHFLLTFISLPLKLISSYLLVLLLSSIIDF